MAKKWIKKERAMGAANNVDSERENPKDNSQTNEKFTAKKLMKKMYGTKD